jgi:hypothetical protein
MSIARHGLIILPYIITFVLVFTFRGFFRALSAYLLGDNTAKDYGFLTLNPAAHVDAFLTLIIVLITAALLLLGFRAEFISVSFLVMLMSFGQRWHILAPVNSFNFSEKTRERSVAIVGAAGICSHFILALTLLYLYRIVMVAPFISDRLKPGASFFIGLAFPWVVFLSILSAIPVPGSDGYMVLEYLFPNAAEWIEANFTPPVMLLFFFFTLCIWSIPYLAFPFWAMQFFIMKLLGMFVFF